MKTFKKISLVLPVFILASILTVSGQGFTDKKDKQSYGIGLDVGKNFLDSSIEIDIESFFQGFRDAYTNQNRKLTEEELTQVLEEFSKELAEKRMEKQRKAAEDNKAAGKAFLDENAKKEGVKVTESGLQYKVIQEGTGKNPTAEDQVQVHYRGTLIDGTEFDSSYSRGEPAVFGVKQVIPGWTEAIMLMKEGSKYNVVIPSDLAYGVNGAGGVIAPNSTLVFDIELIKINP
ncbi:MAG: FKBP-type peptidyl-prolyl cis-trans isomerase [bacterium]